MIRPRQRGAGGVLCISEIKIQNFRSISNSTLELDNISILVGRNDNGKSNVLRALNLFFNNQTDFGRAFRFEEDYNKNAMGRKGKAQEIVIEITVDLPRSYQGLPSSAGEDEVRKLKWRKIWRESGLHSSVRTFANGAEIPGRSKIPTFLDRIRYEYVPAIKDSRFFEDLQGRVYDILSQVVAEDLRSSSRQFEVEIQKHTSELLSSLIIFGRANEIRLPADLRAIFEKLDFNADGMPLSLRGDGIKVRHIPLILRFLAEKQNSVLGSGGVRHTVIWGFEEPENNVEFGAAFEIAESFIEFVKSDLQLILTTHSPAFYNITKLPASDGICRLFSVRKVEGNSTFSLETSDNIDIDIGLMPVIAPYVARANADKRKLESVIDALKSRDRPTLFVEGASDKIIINTFSQADEYAWLRNVNIEDGSDDGYGSAEAVKSRLHAWVLLQKHRKAPLFAAALLDDDAAGKAASQSLAPIVSDFSKIAKCLRLQSFPDIRAIWKQGFRIPNDLEMNYSDEIWMLAEKNGWLTERENLEEIVSRDVIKSIFGNGESPISKLTPTQALRVKFQFRGEAKEAISRYISKRGKNELPISVPYLAPTLKKLQRLFE